MSRRVQFKARFYVLLALLSIALTVAIVTFTQGDHGELREGSLKLALPITGAMVRDESCVSTERYSRAQYLVAEGARVFADTPVANVYTWGYSDDMAQSLAAIRAQIYEAQCGILEGIEYPELIAMETSIREKEQTIRACAQTGVGDMLTLEQELSALMDSRSNYLRVTVQPTEALSALYTEEETKIAQINAYQTQVLSSEEGVVSFYFDGCEDVLNAQTMDMLDVDAVRSVVSSAAQATLEESDTRLYRLIRDDHWCLAFVTGAADPQRTVGGERYTVKFTGYEDELYVGTAREPVISGSNVLNVLEFNTALGALINVRVVRATISLDASGLTVPLSAITMKDGVAGVSIRESGESYRVAVDVLASDEDTALIRSREGVTLYAGMKYESK